MKSSSQNPQRFLPWSRGGNAPGLLPLCCFLVVHSSALWGFPKPGAAFGCIEGLLVPYQLFKQLTGFPKECVVYKETNGRNHFLLNKADDYSSGQPPVCSFLWGGVLELPAACCAVAGMYTKPLPQYLRNANCSCLAKHWGYHLHCLLPLKPLSFICSFCFYPAPETKLSAFHT